MPTITEIMRAQLMGVDPRLLALQGLMGQGVPAPMMVTPSSPAPVTPGAPLAAPPPAAPTFLDQSALARGMASGQPAEVEGIEVTAPRPMSAEDRAARRFGEMRAQSDEAIERAISSARVPPELEAILRRREERYAGEEAESADERRRAGWMALAMAGARMAQSQSPYFAAALAEGLETGLTGFNKARADAAERKARLMDKREQIEIDRITAAEKAREQALSRLQAGLSLTKDQMSLLREEVEAEREAELQPYKIKKAEAEARNAAIEADLTEKFGETEAKLRLDKIRGEIAYTRSLAQNVGKSIERGASSGEIPYGEYQLMMKDYERANALLESDDLPSQLEGVAIMNRINSRRGINPYEAYGQQPPAGGRAAPARGYAGFSATQVGR